MQNYILLLFSLVFTLSCDKVEKLDDIDEEKPVIDLSYSKAFPLVCDTLYFGEPFNLKARFSDNAELGSFSIDIHNNFSHHAHGHKINACDLDLKKTPVNPALILEDYEIPVGKTEYEVDMPMTIPTGNAKGLFDAGDYHFQIFLTDKEGWSSPVGLSVKIIHR